MDDGCVRVFSYGTLGQERVQRALFGRVVPTHTDRIGGWRVEQLEIRDRDVIAKSGMAIHPIAVYTGQDTDTIDGHVLSLNADEYAAVEAYEVDDYTPVRVTLHSKISALLFAKA